MYGAGGGGCGDGDLSSMREDESRRPHMVLITRMCKRLGIEEENRRTINTDNAWEYYWELFEKIARIFPREKVCDADFWGGYLSPDEIDKHFTYIEQLKRKTA